MNRYFLAFLGVNFYLFLSAQTVTLQFMQTEYDIKELYMVDESTGYAVGDMHWDQVQKAFRSTILKTLDGGTTWSPQSVPFSGDLWDVHFTGPDRGWAVGASGLLLYTGDGGENWTRKDIGTTLDFKSLCFTDASHGWVVANEVVLINPFDDPEAWEGKIWHTSDGGNIWTEQSLPADAGLIHSICFTDNLEGWAVGIKNLSLNGFAETQCAAYHTTDGGTTWEEKYSPSLDLVFTDIDFPTLDTGYMVAFKSSSGEGNGLFFRTSDGGDNWERSSEENDVLWEVAFVDSQRGYAIGADYISAWGPPVYRTMDGGDSWDKIMMQEHDNQGLYGLYVSENRVFGLGDDGYMIQSDDPWGEILPAYEEQLFSCELIDTLYQFEDVFFINPQKGWAVGQKSAGPQAWAQVIMHTGDGGATWTEQYALQIDPVWAYSFRLNAVQFVNETTGWAVGDIEEYGDATTSGVLFTNDGGENWTQQAQDVSEGQLVDLFFLDDQRGWVLTDKRTYPENYVQLLKTTDGGANWEMVSTGQEGMITIGFAIKTGTLLFQNEQTGWILGAQCDLLKTEDGGETWSPQSLPQEWTNTFDIGFSNELKGTICGEANFITTDGGENWSEGLDSDHTLTDLCFTDTLHGWMVGEWAEIFYTLDGGTSWTKSDHETTSAALKAVSFPDNANGWAAGRGGAIIHIDPSTLSAAFPGAPSGFTTELMQNQPNPFTRHTAIHFYLSEPGDVVLAVYDMNGRQIRTLLDGFRTDGSHKVEWSGEDATGRQVKPGIYIYKLITNRGTASRTMVVL
jgi:photosystem II stability/assembly factor-like uncharacterized protein